MSLRSIYRKDLNTCIQYLEHLELGLCNESGFQSLTPKKSGQQVIESIEELFCKTFVSFIHVVQSHLLLFYCEKIHDHDRLFALWFDYVNMPESFQHPFYTLINLFKRLSGLESSPDKQHIEEQIRKSLPVMLAVLAYLDYDDEQASFRKGFSFDTETTIK